MVHQLSLSILVLTIATPLCFGAAIPENVHRTLQQEDRAELADEISKWVSKLTQDWIVTTLRNMGQGDGDLSFSKKIYPIENHTTVEKYCVSSKDQTSCVEVGIMKKNKADIPIQVRVQRDLNMHDENYEDDLPVNERYSEPRSFNSRARPNSFGFRDEDMEPISKIREALPQGRNQGGQMEKLRDIHRGESSHYNMHNGRESQRDFGRAQHQNSFKDPTSRGGMEQLRHRQSSGEHDSIRRNRPGAFQGTFDAETDSRAPENYDDIGKFKFEGAGKPQQDRLGHEAANTPYGSMRKERPSQGQFGSGQHRSENSRNFGETNDGDNSFERQEFGMPKYNQNPQENHGSQRLGLFNKEKNQNVQNKHGFEGLHNQRTKDHYGAGKNTNFRSQGEDFRPRNQLKKDDSDYMGSKHSADRLSEGKHYGTEFQRLSTEEQSNSFNEHQGHSNQQGRGQNEHYYDEEDDYESSKPENPVVEPVEQGNYDDGSLQSAGELPETEFKNAEMGENEFVLYNGAYKAPPKQPSAEDIFNRLIAKRSLNFDGEFKKHEKYGDDYGTDEGYENPKVLRNLERGDGGKKQSSSKKEPNAVSDFEKKSGVFGERDEAKSNLNINKYDETFEGGRTKQPVKPYNQNEGSQRNPQSDSPSKKENNYEHYQPNRGPNPSDSMLRNENDREHYSSDSHSKKENEREQYPSDSHSKKENEREQYPSDSHSDSRKEQNGEHHQLDSDTRKENNQEHNRPDSNSRRENQEKENVDLLFDFIKDNSEYQSNSNARKENNGPNSNTRKEHEKDYNSRMEKNKNSYQPDSINRKESNRDDYSSDSHSRKENNRNYSTDSNLKKENNRADYSPDSMQESKRNNLPDSNTKKDNNRDEYSPNSHSMNYGNRNDYLSDSHSRRENNQDNSPLTNFKKEKIGDGYSPDSRMKESNRNRYSSDSNSREGNTQHHSEDSLKEYQTKNNTAKLNQDRKPASSSMDKEIGNFEDNSPHDAIGDFRKHESSPEPPAKYKLNANDGKSATHLSPHQGNKKYDPSQNKEKSTNSADDFAKKIDDFGNEDEELIDNFTERKSPPKDTHGEFENVDKNSGGIQTTSDWGDFKSDSEGNQNSADIPDIGGGFESPIGGEKNSDVGLFEEYTEPLENIGKVVDTSDDFISRRRRSSSNNTYADEKKDFHLCRLPKPSKTYEAFCKMLPKEAKCNLYCIRGHTFPEGIMKQTSCSQYTGKWTTRFDECKPFVDCSLKLKSAGSLECEISSLLSGKKCSISCTREGVFNEAPLKEYECHPDGKWSPSLPHCVESDGVALVRPPAVREIKDFTYP